MDAASWVLLLLVLVVVVVVIGLSGGRSSVDWRTEPDSSRTNRRYPVVRRKVLTDPEQVLFYRLRDALPDHIVLAQVAASRLVRLRGNVRYRLAEFRRFSQLSIDFVICRPDSSIIAAIELDDPSHFDADRAEVDSRKNRLLEDAGIRLLRWQTTEIPSVIEIRAAVTRSAVPSQPSLAGN